MQDDAIGIGFSENKHPLISPHEGKYFTNALDLKLYPTHEYPS